MTVEELISALRDLDPEATVVVQAVSMTNWVNEIESGPDPVDEDEYEAAKKATLDQGGEFPDGPFVVLKLCDETVGFEEWDL